MARETRRLATRSSRLPCASSTPRRPGQPKSSQRSRNADTSRMSYRFSQAGPRGIKFSTTTESVCSLSALKFLCTSSGEILPATHSHDLNKVTDISIASPPSLPTTAGPSCLILIRYRDLELRIDTVSQTKVVFLFRA